MVFTKFVHDFGIRGENVFKLRRNSHLLDPNRHVGHESRKTYADKIASGFFDKYLSGDAVLEIGFRGGDYPDVVPIVPHAIGVDLDYPGYDGIHLPFPDESQDPVYNSHCLEHIANYHDALLEWYRVLKIGGYLIIVVPHQHMFERRARPPSRLVGNHFRFYTPSKLLREIEETYAPNSYRVRHLIDNDKGYDYRPPENEHWVTGCYEIELVLEKLQQPSWSLV
jgi:SAM-dependent methyltransferase